MWPAARLAAAPADGAAVLPVAVPAAAPADAAAVLPAVAPEGPARPARDSAAGAVTGAAGTGVTDGGQD